MHNTTTSPSDGDKADRLQEVQNPAWSPSIDIITTLYRVTSQNPYFNFSSSNPSPPIIGARLHIFLGQLGICESKFMDSGNTPMGYKIPVQRVNRWVQSTWQTHFSTYSKSSVKTTTVFRTPREDATIQSPSIWTVDQSKYLHQNYETGGGFHSSTRCKKYTYTWTIGYW